MADYKENTIEFLTGEKYASVTFTNRKHINRIKKLHEKRPSEFKSYIENEDGSIWAKIPLNWVKINGGKSPDAPKREMTDEQKAKIVEAARAYREQKALAKNAS